MFFVHTSGRLSERQSLPYLLKFSDEQQVIKISHTPKELGACRTDP
jgi:hypothetical protein